MDETLKFSFEDIASVTDESITIPAQQSTTIPVSLTIPEEPFDGMILGSIRVLREPTATEIAEAGAILNQFAFVTAVRLVQDNNAENIPAEFILADVRPELVHSMANIIATIRNPQPKIIRGAGVSANIYPQGSNNAVFVYHSETFDMAPNSVFNLSFIDRERQGLTAGNYTAVIEITFEGEVWRFTESFTIEPQVAAEINAGADLAEPTTFWDEIPAWMIFAAASVLMILIMLIILVILLTRKRNAPFKEVSQNPPQYPPQSTPPVPPQHIQQNIPQYPPQQPDLTQKSTYSNQY